MNIKNELIAFCICVNQSKDDPKFDLDSYADEYIERNPHLKDDWLSLDDNTNLFSESAKNNCLVRFDDGTECRFNDDHPMAVLTHFKLEPNRT